MQVPETATGPLDLRTDQKCLFEPSECRITNHVGWLSPGAGPVSRTTFLTQMLDRPLDHLPNELRSLFTGVNALIEVLYVYVVGRTVLALTF
jgi:hypothetical protein